MAEVAAIGGAPTQSGSVGQQATNAFGMEFEDLLRIVLTQLTYQDPLKPMDNFEFVSQLAQFSQIQQGQTMSDRLLGILQAEATNQATSILGRSVSIPAGQDTVTGDVTRVSFRSGEPRVSIRTADGRTFDDIALTTITTVAEE